MSRIFTGSFRDSAGSERSFRVEAETHEQAEAYLAAIASTGVIDGELVDDGWLSAKPRPVISHASICGSLSGYVEAVDPHTGSAIRNVVEASAAEGWVMVRSRGADGSTTVECQRRPVALVPVVSPPAWFWERAINGDYEDTGVRVTWGAL